jgi:hypothetical protein
MRGIAAPFARNPPELPLRHRQHGTRVAAVTLNHGSVLSLEAAMAMIDERHHGSHEPQQQAPVTSRAHPGIYAIVIALTLWFIFSAWSFAGGGVTDYLLFIVSGFLCVAIGLPLILFRVARARPSLQGRSSSQGYEQPPLRDWMHWRYDTSTERLTGWDAAAQILLPIAAAAIGMTAIGIAYHVAGG